MMTAETEYISQMFASALDYAKNGALKQSATVLSQILTLSPDHLKSLDLMGYVQYFLKNPHEAARYCEKALQIKPNHAYALKGLGLSLAACGKVDEGIARIKQAISASPHYFDPHWDLAVTLARAGRQKDAIAQIDKAIDAFPDQEKRLLFLKSRVENGLSES
ncbi:MAG: tetratricopeptide repeat protein [Deltaproteobacteria bacterium]|nr:tetratricopeptide repeat protein [Deltaproteobacteria bacterium]